MLLGLLFTASLSILSPFANAKLIDLHAPKLNLTRPADAVEWMNNAPPFYFYQNDADIPDAYVVSRASVVTLPNGMIRTTTAVSNLCIPASLTTAFIAQKWYKENPASSLQLPGVSADQGIVDPIAILSAIVQKTGFAHPNKKDVDVASAFLAAADRYQASGLADARIQITSQYVGLPSNPIANVIPSAPTLDTVVNALQAGNQVIISVRSPLVSHEINVWGYKKTADGKTSIYISDSDSNYFGEAQVAQHRTQYFEEIAVDESSGITNLSGFINPLLKNGGFLKAVYSLKAN